MVSRFKGLQRWTLLVWYLETQEPVVCNTSHLTLQPLLQRAACCHFGCKSAERCRKPEEMHITAELETESLEKFFGKQRQTQRYKCNYVVCFGNNCSHRMLLTADVLATKPRRESIEICGSCQRRIKLARGLKLKMHLTKRTTVTSSILWAPRDHHQAYRISEERLTWYEKATGKLYGLPIFFTKMYIRIFLPRRNTSLHSSQVQYRDSN